MKPWPGLCDGQRMLPALYFTLGKLSPNWKFLQKIRCNRGNTLGAAHTTLLYYSESHRIFGKCIKRPLKRQAITHITCVILNALIDTSLLHTYFCPKLGMKGIWRSVLT